MSIYNVKDKLSSTIYEMKFMNLTSLQHYRPSTTKFVYMCALKKFQLIENSWYYINIFHQIYHFVIPMVFNVAIFATYIFIQLWITFEYVWFVDATFWTRENKWKITMSKKLEKLKIKHEEKKNCDQIVIMVQ